MGETSLTVFTQGALLLAEANTIQKAKELKDLSLTAAEWARRKNMGEEAVQHCLSYSLQAEVRLGEMIAEAELAKGGEQYHRSPKGTAHGPVAVGPTLADLGVTYNQSSRAQTLAKLPDDRRGLLFAGKLKPSDAIREVRRCAVREHLDSISVREAKAVDGLFDVIVIDPPWPLEKTELDVKPNQVALDYPTMALEEIANMAIPSAQDCHLWLWTTQRFLPSAFGILDKWGARYVCAFVWHKPGGVQPLNLPQFNCEFCLYARIGTPVFLDTKALPTCFEAPRGKHSEKPEAFYAVLRRVTAGRRLDMFSRRVIEGFYGWGKEATA